MDYHGPGDVDPQQNIHLAPHVYQSSTPQTAHPSVTFVSPYRPQAVSPVDPHAEAGAARVLHPSPTLLAHPQSVPQAYYTDGPRQIIAPSTPSQGASPRFAHTSVPGHSPRQSQASHIPTDRSLPSRDVSDESIDEAYAQFILYCNPGFSLDTDTSELKKAFRTPPKSESKSFSTFRLFELISKLEAKEIKTWTELALELGVEKPNAEKGQSTQKVQQYTVRLKRWMRALHIDAFFEYLLDKPHPYCRQIPHPNEPFPDVRDGVPTEEDLAIRALDPKFRPKRGRRKADDQDDPDEPMSAIEPKRPHLDTSVAFGGPHAYANPHSALPTSAMGMSAHPDDLDRFVHDPWATATTPATARSAGVGHFRWRVTADNPQTPNPMSAVTPLSAQPPDGVFDEPTSAISPNPKPRSRRRHGPAVSSAWSSNNTTPSGRLRGRPPSNRSIRDGPFVTFPANPKAKEGPTIDLSRTQVNASTTEPSSTDPQITSQQQQPSPMSTTSQHGQPLPPPPPIHQPLQSRPERMQLQIPQHTGNPVHLVTPTVLINGAMSPPAPPTALPPTASTATGTLDTASSFRSTNASVFSQSSAASDFGEHDASGGPGGPFLPWRGRAVVQSSPGGPGPSPHEQHPQAHHHHTMSAPAVRPAPAPSISEEDIKRALAADLLRADITGLARGRRRLKGAEAKELAAAMLARLGGEGAKRDFISSNAETVASWLGLDLGRRGAGAHRSQQFVQKRITVQRYRVHGDGYDSPVDDEDIGGSDVMDITREGEHGAQQEIRETFDVEWSASLGALSGSFGVRGLVVDGKRSSAATTTQRGVTASGVAGDSGAHERSAGDTRPDSAGEQRWKARIDELERRLEASQDEVQRLREKILEAVL